MNSASRSGKRSIQSATTGSSRGNKSLRWTSDDAPSPSASNDNGYRLFHERVQSFLCHPLGLPLVAAFHRQVLLPVESLTYPVAAFPEAIGTTDKTGDNVFSQSYNTKKGENETDLTTALKGNIQDSFRHKLVVTTENWIGKVGRTDLAFFFQKRQGRQQCGEDEWHQQEHTGHAVVCCGTGHEQCRLVAKLRPRVSIYREDAGEIRRTNVLSETTALGHHYS